MAKTRNRLKRPAWSYAGITATEWRLTAELVKWAQESSEFRSLVTLLVNDRADILEGLPPATENCLLGRHQAYDAVRRHLLSLAESTRPTAQPPDPNRPTYEREDMDDNEPTLTTDFSD